jgi:hypothetical protein
MHRRYGLVPFLFLSALGAACASSAGSEPSSDGPAHASDTPTVGIATSTSPKSHPEWRKQMAKTPTPKDGCFTVSHPSTTWVEVPCIKAPDYPWLPARAEAVGSSSGDWVAQESTGVISSAEGAFPLVTGVTSQNEGFSLQLNSNPAFAGPYCAENLQDPQLDCKEWQQFVYSPNSLVIQYWLIDVPGGKCPSSSWIPFNNGGQADCFMNNPKATFVPSFPLADLGGVTMTATVGSSDTVILSVEDTLFTLSVPSFFSLNKWWTAAEFNVFGPGNDSEVVFGANSTLLVRTSVESSLATSVPSCVNTSFTGETNSLDLVPSSCCVLDGLQPAVQFTESNVVGATAPGCPSSACTPHACSSGLCDTQSDGCGGVITCGGCASGQTCEYGICTANTPCVTEASACANTCGGVKSNGCGGSYNCPSLTGTACCAHLRGKWELTPAPAHCLLE